MKTIVEHPSDGAHARVVKITTRILPDGPEQELRLGRDVQLRELLEEGARAAGETIFPSADHPLDTLHNLRKGEASDPISDLDQTLEEYLQEPKTTKSFGTKLNLAFRVNATWKIAPNKSMTPREILTLFNLDIAFTLYREDSAEPLPIDTPIEIERGMTIEAQRDGKYGGPATAPSLLQEELDELVRAGFQADLVTHNGQRYLRVRDLQAPSPPWDHPEHDILIALPGAYEDGASLDAFYLAQPSTYLGKTHRRVGNAGNPLTFDGRTWPLVSWHYPNPKGWKKGVDTLLTHVLHCKAFFKKKDG